MNDFWHELKKPIIGLAPMDGVTDYPMRQIQCLIKKPSVIYTEFVSAEGFIRKPEKFIGTLTFDENQRPIVAQIFGYTPEAFYETAKQLAKMKFDGIDINMGCPARKILGHGGGGALIGNFTLAEEIIKSALQGIKDAKEKIPLSVKTRIGKSTIIARDWLSFLASFSLSEITVHGRLLSQGHKGEVNWEEIKIAAEICHKNNITCLGNGGIQNIVEAKQKIEDFGVDGVLIGQAALGNPWLFADKKPSQEEILETIIKHAELTEKFYEAKRFCTVLKHLGWYPRGFQNCIKLKVELLKTKNLKEVKQVIASFGRF